MSFILSRASAALLKGEKLTRVTILPNFERSSMESWTDRIREPIFSWSFTSKMAYPDADSNSACVTILWYGMGTVDFLRESEARVKF